MGMQKDPKKAKSLRGHKPAWSSMYSYGSDKYSAYLTPRQKAITAEEALLRQQLELNKKRQEAEMYEEHRRMREEMRRQEEEARSVYPTEIDWGQPDMYYAETWGQDAVVAGTYYGQTVAVPPNQTTQHWDQLYVGVSYDYDRPKYTWDRVPCNHPPKRVATKTIPDPNQHWTQATFEIREEPCRCWENAPMVVTSRDCKIIKRDLERFGTPEVRAVRIADVLDWAIGPPEGLPV